VAPALPDAGWSFFRVWEEEELRAAWSRASIRRWRQQSVPHSGEHSALWSNPKDIGIRAKFDGTGRPLSFIHPRSGRSLLIVFLLVFNLM
jgi:hypothetical protein